MARSPSAPTFSDRLVHDWYLPQRTFLTGVLTPLSWLYGAVVASRRAAYRAGILKTATLPVPVIVVGNVTAGGTGKTPLVIWLVGALAARGMSPGIVSRGYGAEARGSSRGEARGEAGDAGGAEAGTARSTGTARAVDTAHAAGTTRAVNIDDDARATGDEPLLLARTGHPVWIGADRVAATRALLARHPEVDVIVSDDGLQHYALARNFEIVVIDGRRAFGNGALLPAGPLREPASRVDESDAIVVNGPCDFPIANAPRAPTFRMTLRGGRFMNLADPAREAGAEDFRGLRVHAVAGIGNPERFFDHLRGLGLDPVCHAFPDHHRYEKSDLALADADAILMTEKDAIKCRQFADARMWSLPVAAEVEDGLIERVLEKIDGPQTA